MALNRTPTSGVSVPRPFATYPSYPLGDDPSSGHRAVSATISRDSGSDGPSCREVGDALAIAARDAPWPLTADELATAAAIGLSAPGHVLDDVLGELVAAGRLVELQWQGLTVYAAGSGSP